MIYSPLSTLTVRTQQEQSPEINFEFSSRQVIQIKDEPTQQEQLLKTSINPSLQEVNLEESAQVDEEDLFGEEVDFSKEYKITDIQNSDGLAEQIISKEINVTREETSKINAEWNINHESENIDHSITKEQQVTSIADETAYSSVEDQRIVLSPQACTKMLQGLDRAVKNLKAQNVHQQVIPETEEHSSVKNIRKDSEEIKTTLALGIEGLAISRRTKEVNEELGSANSIKTKEQLSNQGEYSNHHIEKRFANIVNTHEKRAIFDQILQSARVSHRTFLGEKNFSIAKEEVVQKIAEQELKQEVLKHESLELSEEKMEGFANRFFRRAIEEGGVIGADGQPVDLSQEEIEELQKEFTKSFIYYLASKSLLQRQNKEESNHNQEYQIKATLLLKRPLAQREDIQGSIDQEIIKSITKKDITTLQDLLEQIIKRANDEKREEESLQQYDLKQYTIKQIEIKKAILKEEYTKKSIQHMVVESNRFALVILRGRHP